MRAYALSWLLKSKRSIAAGARGILHGFIACVAATIAHWDHSDSSLQSLQTDSGHHRLTCDSHASQIAETHRSTLAPCSRRICSTPTRTRAARATRHARPRCCRYLRPSRRPAARRTTSPRRSILCAPPSGFVFVFLRRLEKVREKIAAMICSCMGGRKEWQLVLHFSIVVYFLDCFQSVLSLLHSYCIALPRAPRWSLKAGPAPLGDCAFHHALARFHWRTQEVDSKTSIAIPLCLCFRSLTVLDCIHLFHLLRFVMLSNIITFSRLIFFIVFPSISPHIFESKQNPHHTQDFALAQRHFTRADPQLATGENIAMLQSWMSDVAPAELDLLVARTVLQVSYRRCQLVTFAPSE